MKIFIAASMLAPVFSEGSSTSYLIKEMFTHKIHTNSIPEHITTTIPIAAAAHELRGVAHLLEDLQRTLHIFWSVMPDVFTPDDFLSFCKPYVPIFSEICFISKR